MIQADAHPNCFIVPPAYKLRHGRSTGAGVMAADFTLGQLNGISDEDEQDWQDRLSHRVQSRPDRHISG